MLPFSALLIDHEELGRKSLVALLRTEAKQVTLLDTGDPAAAPRLVREHAINVIVLRAHSVHDVAGVSELHEATGAVGILVLSSNCDADTVLAAVRGGARGFVTQNVEAREFVVALASVARGDVAFGRDAMRLIVEHLSLPAPLVPIENLLGSKFANKPKLTYREVEVLTLVSDGSSNRDIAEALVISEHTVRAHLRNILDKLRLENRIQAAAWATRMGIARTHAAVS